MRIRIVKSLAGVLDGQSLGQFTQGLLYEIDDAFARELISLGCAREETSHAHAPVIREADDTLDEARLTGGVRVVATHTAHDWGPDRRRSDADRRKQPRNDRRKSR